TALNPAMPQPGTKPKRSKTQHDDSGNPRSRRAEEADPVTAIAELFADVNGVRLHYRIRGSGSPVVLLHGYTQTSHMWHPIGPVLAQRHTVIAPDLRGAGGSAKPESGYDKKTLARDIQALTLALGFDRVSVVGHDIGLMVAYA